MDKSKKHVLFRADGNSEIGLGHVYRCLAIAERLHEEFICFFAIKQPSVELQYSIGKVAHLILIDEYENYNDEAKHVAVNIVPEYKIDILTLDGYFFDTAYQKIIKENSRAVLINIDDDQPFHYVSDIVINHAGGVKPESISKEAYTKFYGGYDYLLLRKEFLSSLNKEKKVQGLNTVLICFGGADPDNYTKKVVDCLKTEHGIHKITVITGSSYTQIEELQASVFGYPHIDIKNNLDAKHLAELMTTTDVAIVPSSTIALEAFASKMILITGTTADNQAAIYSGLIKEEAVIGIGAFDSSLTCSILLKKMSEASKKYSNYTFFSKNKLRDSVVTLYQSVV